EEWVGPWREGGEGGRDWFTEQAERPCRRGHGLCRNRGGLRRFLILNVPPLRTFRRRAAASARAFRIAERQPHLEGKIGAQKIGNIGTVRLHDEPFLVLAEPKRIE